MTDTVVSEQDFSIGRMLKEARASRGVSLEEAARVTRIARRYLVALEEEAFEKLPSETHARGFLRAYANFLCLSSEELLGRFQASAPGDLDFEEGVVPAASGTDKAEHGSGKRWLFALVAMSLIAVLAVFIRSGPDMKADSVGIEPQATPVAEKVLPPPSQPLYSSIRKSDSSAVSATEPKVSATKVPTTVPGVILRLKALEDGSLDLTIDEAISQHYDLKAGDLIEWKAEKVFFLELENSGGVEAVLNGKLLKPFGRQGAPAHVVLSAEYDEEKANY